MAHTYTNILTHFIFSTKERYPFLDADLKPRLFPYMCGIIKEINGIPASINGPADHVHVRSLVHPAVSVSDFVRTLKSNSSRWVHDEWPNLSKFAWQTGYGAFSVSRSMQDEVKAYIANQEAHHRKVTFQEEFIAFLKKHGIQYDERYTWD